MEPSQTKGKVLAKPLVYKWVELVVSKHKTDYQKVMMAFMKEHYKDMELYRVLAAGMKIPGARPNAEKMVGFLIDLWIQENKSYIGGFNLLSLYQMNGNPLECPYFTKWAKLVVNQHSSLEEAYKVMLDILSSYFKSKNALVSALYTLDGARNFPTRDIIVCQFNEWKREGKNVADVFKILDLHRTEGELFESPVYRCWVNFVRSKISSESIAIEMMLSVLGVVNKDDLQRVLAMKTGMEKMKSVAEILQNGFKEELPGPSKRQYSDLTESPPSKRQNSNFD